MATIFIVATINFAALFQHRLFQSEPINYGLDNFQPHMTNLIDLYQALTGIRVETMRIYFDRLRTVLEMQVKNLPD